MADEYIYAVWAGTETEIRRYRLIQRTARTVTFDTGGRRRTAHVASKYEQFYASEDEARAAIRTRLEEQIRILEAELAEAREGLDAPVKLVVVT